MAVLKVTIKEELVLNGKDMGNENFLSITGVNNAEHRVVSVDTSEQSLLLFDTAISAGTLEEGTLKHLRLTNLDTTYKVILRIEDSTGNLGQAIFEIEPGESFIMGNDRLFADNTNTSASLVNIDAIYVKADTSSCELEMFVATT